MTEPLNNEPQFSSAGRGPSKVLIVLYGAIGDVIRALPLARRIKTAWPDCQLCWAVEPASQALVAGHPSIDRVLLFDRPKGWREALRFLRSLKEEKFDLVLDLQRHLKSGLSSRSTKAARRIGFNPRNAKEFNWLFNTEYIPAVKNFSLKIEHYQLFGDKLGLPRLEPLEFGLIPDAEQLAAAEKKLQSAADEQGVVLAPQAWRIGLILGSSWKSRWWPAEHYIETIHRLAALGFTAILFGGKGEADFGEQICRGLGSDRSAAVQFAGKTTLRELAAVLKNVAAVAGPDSGPMHLAAAVGIPVVSLWGSTSPARSAPYGPQHLVLQSAIGCSPCYRRTCPGLNNLCMRSIPPEAVLAALTAAARTQR